ncbi:MAG: hypothetical protein QNJ64_19040 [Crocosphaera sp.]|nr:hypothetical protein [Crocosphaera sp.]
MTIQNEEKSPSNLVKLIRTTFIGGFLVILPAYLAILGFNKTVKALIGLVVVLLKPISNVLGIDNNSIAVPVSLFLFLLICFIAGVILKTRYSVIVKKTVEPIFKKIPGYLLIRSLTNRVAKLEKSETLGAAFVCLGQSYQSLSPAFVIEKHDNGMHTVFVPTVPTPTVGNLYVVPDNRVFPIDVPLLDMVKFVSKWGEASPQLSEAIKKINTKVDSESS